MARSLRLPAIIALAGVLLPVALAASPATARPGATPPEDEFALPRMVTVKAADFRDDAEELPPGLTAAIERDTDLTAAQYLANAEAGDIARGVVDALATAIDVRGSEMRGSELVVYVADEAAAAVVEQSGATAVIGEQVLPDYSDVVLNPVFDLRGGEHYYYDGFRCTTGFVGTDATQHTQLLTAGHCTTNNVGFTRTQYRTQNTPFDYSGGAPSLSGATALGPGVSGSYQAGSGYDHGLISLAAPANWNPLPQITTWNYGGGSNTQNPLTIRDARAPLVGETICKSGATSGWTCGGITAVDRAACVGGSGGACTGGYVVNGVFANICLRAGDSGGPAVVGSTAIAVNSASSAGSSCLPSNIGVFAPLYSSGSATVDNPFGNRSAASRYPAGAWEITVAVDDVVLTTPASPVSYYTGSTFSGTLTNSTPRTRIELIVDGRIVKTANVALDGSWSISIADTDPGVRSFQLRARWGQRSTSTVITGSWTTLLDAPQRFSGADRYAAAASISEGQFTTPPVEKVFVATGDNFPDALGAGPVAAVFGAPLLLTPRSGILPASVANELDRLNPEQIIVIGGATSVPPSLVSAMSVYATNEVTPTVRINGETRFDVSLELLRYAQDAGLFQNVSRAWVVTGNNFADALSVSAAAAAEGVPVILVPGTDSQVSSTVFAAIEGLNPGKISVGGGPNSVSSSIVSQLGAIATVTRFGGADRFEASVNINRAVHPTAHTVFIANGLNYPDALAGGVVAGLTNSPLFIVVPQCVPVSVITEIDRLAIDHLKILGGPNSVNEQTGNLTRC